MKRTPPHAIVDDWGKRPIDVTSPDPGLNDWRGQRLQGGASVQSVLEKSDEARRVVSAMSPSKRRALSRQARTGSSPVSNRPLWIHPSAARMVVEGLNIPTRTLTIGNKDGATMTVRYKNPVHFNDRSHRVWDVSYSLCDKERTVACHWNGCFTEQQLHLAFLTDGSKLSSDLVDPGYFYRHGQWLSIPVKGTGERNSPVLGILVTQEIQRAVSRLLASKQ